jgi:hypothetical protein
MMITGRRLDSLRYPIAALTLVAIMGTGVVAWSRQQISSDQAILANQETQLREARKRFERSGQEREQILRFMGPYQDLRSRGVIGPERRINWLDALRVSNRQAQLFGAEYQISTQQPYPFAQELNASKLGMAQSMMKLSLRLAHEGELMRFFRLLEGQNVGTFEINQCVLDRSASFADTAPKAQANLSAVCELAWITINPEPVERKP